VCSREYGYGYVMDVCTSNLVVFFLNYCQCRVCTAAAARTCATKRLYMLLQSTVLNGSMTTMTVDSSLGSRDRGGAPPIVIMQRLT